MINFDDHSQFSQFDPDDMLGHIDALPDQLETAWAHAHAQDLPASFKQARRIVLTGMGGSAIGGDYFAALVAPASPVPVVVNRGYDLPAYVAGPETLVIASSHSGNTEETLAALDVAQTRGAQLMAITTGGELAARADAAGIPTWRFDYPSQPRAAFGWSFGLLVGLAQRLGLAGDLSADVDETLTLLREYRAICTADSPLAENPAKRLAGQCMGRIAVIYGGGLMAPVARRWKCQINENAKQWAEYDELPEQNHNGVAGSEFPPAALSKLFAIFLKSSTDHPRVSLRQDLTFRLYLQEAIGVDNVTARGESRLAQLFNATQYGDYVSYYLAMMNQVDPTPIPQITALKEGLTVV